MNVLSTFLYCLCYYYIFVDPLPPACLGASLSLFVCRLSFSWFSVHLYLSCLLKMKCSKHLPFLQVYVCLALHFLQMLLSTSTSTVLVSLESIFNLTVSFCTGFYLLGSCLNCHYTHFFYLFARSFTLPLMFIKTCLVLDWVPY